MSPLRAAIYPLIFLLLSQSGCVVYDGLRAVTSPVGVATKLVTASSKAAATSAGAAGSVSGGVAAGAGRVAVSGLRSASRVSASSLQASSSVAGSTVRATGSVGGGTVRGAGRVSRAGIDAVSRVSASSVRASGSLTATSINRLARMSQAGMITFVDLSTGQVVRVPWRAGLNVYGGSALANLRTAERALAVIRGGRLIYNTVKALADARALPLEPGDVLRLADRD